MKKFLNYIVFIAVIFCFCLVNVKGEEIITDIGEVTGSNPYTITYKYGYKKCNCDSNAVTIDCTDTYLKITVNSKNSNIGGDFTCTAYKGYANNIGYDISNIYKFNGTVASTLELDHDSSLKSLSVSPGTLSPSFSKDTKMYTVTVKSSVQFININAQATSSKASVEGTGKFELNKGGIFYVTVNAESGDSTKYTIVVNNETTTTSKEKDYTDNTGDGDPVVSVDETDEITAQGFCSTTNVIKAFRLIGIILLIARISVPLIIVGFGIKELYNSVINGEQDKIKKGTTSIIIRIVIGFLIFFLPILFNAILKSANLPDEYGVCYQCMFNPTNEDCTPLESNDNSKIKNCVDAKTQAECPSTCSWGYDNSSEAHCYYKKSNDYRCIKCEYEKTGTSGKYHWIKGEIKDTCMDGSATIYKNITSESDCKNKNK